MNGQQPPSRPLVSIVLPTYNQARFLPAALGSILKQTFRDFELIVVNDGSTDRTAAILDSYRRRHRIRVITQSNQGLPTALNTGFADAQGQYLTWTSSDNILLPTMIEVLSRELEDHPSVGVVYSDWYFIDEDGEVLTAFETLDYDQYLLLYANIVHCSFLFRRECMDRAGLYDPELEYGEDWEYWIRLSRFTQMKRVPQALYCYRLHKRSMTSDLVQGRVKESGYDKFAPRIRQGSPLAWYYAKIKWRVLSWLTGRDMRREWLDILETHS